MQKNIFSFLLLVFILSTGSSGLHAAGDAEKILNHVDDLFRGDSSYGTFTMTVVTGHYSRSLSLEAWSKGKDYSLIRILSPAKEKNTATLKAENNIWNYLPKVNRVIKVPSSMMGGAWMGSHFTNDDLVKESRMADDYTSALTDEKKHDQQETMKLVLTPRETAAVVWGKVVVTVYSMDWTPVRIDYFDEDLELRRTMSFSATKKLGGRMLPTELKMQPIDKPGEYTMITYHDIVFDIGLDKEVFSIRRLKNPGRIK